MRPRRAGDEIEHALAGYSTAALTMLAAAWGVPSPAQVRKHELIEALARRMTAPTNLGGLLAGLPAARRDALAYVARRGDAVAVAAVLQFLERQSGTATAATETLLDLLRRGLLLYRAGGPWKVDFSAADPTLACRQVWVAPAVAAAVREPGGWGELLPPLPAPERCRRGDPAALLRDVFLILRSIRGRRVRLTRVGRPHRVDLRQLARELHPASDHDRWEEHIPAVTFALALVEGAGLVVRREDSIELAAAADEFLGAPFTIQVVRLFAGWLRSDWNELAQISSLALDMLPGRLSDVPDGERRRAARHLIVEVLVEIRDGQWRSTGDISEAIRRRDPEFITGAATSGATIRSAAAVEVDEAYRGIRRAGLPYPANRLSRRQHWDEVEGAYLREVLGGPLTRLGIVDTAAGVDGRLTAFRVAELGVAIIAGAARETDSSDVGRRVVVQPNFEVIVLDALHNLRLVRQIETFALLRSIDRAAVLVLTREALVAGLQSGLTLADVEALLETESGRPLPQNIRYSLEEWRRGSERVRLYRGATILEAADTASLDRWLSEIARGGGVARRLSATILLLDAAAAAALSRLDGGGNERWEGASGVPEVATGSALALAPAGAVLGGEAPRRSVTAPAPAARRAGLVEVSVGAAAGSVTSPPAGIEPAPRRLRGRALRTFLEQAIAARAGVILLLWGGRQGLARPLSVRPRYTEQRASGYYLVATVEGGAERSFRLDDIAAVAREEQA